MTNKECAAVFINAVKELATNPGRLENLEFYLQNHFDIWMKKFANTPENIAHEIKQFSEMEV